MRERKDLFTSQGLSNMDFHSYLSIGQSRLTLALFDHIPWTGKRALSPQPEACLYIGNLYTPPPSSTTTTMAFAGTEKELIQRIWTWSDHSDRRVCINPHVHFLSYHPVEEISLLVPEEDEGALPFRH